MGAVMKHTMVVRHPDTLEATAVVAGEARPDWAKELIHDDNLESASAAKTGDSDEDKGYAGQTPDELKAEAEKRELTVTGTGANGNVLKGDLVAALEADDASKA